MIEALKINDETKVQTIYINIDDSGKLSTKEKVSVYGGIVFLNKKEKDKFITQYKSIVNSIKCKYCCEKKEFCCGNNCPELKHNNLKPNDKRRIFNYIKKYFIGACIINNEKIYDYIMNSASSKGRYLDYALRITIKGIIQTLIKEKRVDENKPIRIILNLDEQATKSNGYYNLKDGLIEELKYGIINYNYGKKHSPIIKNELQIKLTYQKSDKSYVVQAADLIAGSVRKKYLQYNKNQMQLQNALDFIDYKVKLPY